MSRYCSEYTYGSIKICCTGQNVVIIDVESGCILGKYRIPYVYNGVLIEKDKLFVVKSTAGYIASINIQTGCIEKIRVSDYPQDGGYSVCPWNGRLYNWEHVADGYRISIYDVASLELVDYIPINGDIVGVYDIEFNLEKREWYVSLSANYNANYVVKMIDDRVSGMRLCIYDEIIKLYYYNFCKRCGFSKKSMTIFGLTDADITSCITLEALYEKGEAKL